MRKCCPGLALVPALGLAAGDPLATAPPTNAPARDAATNHISEALLDSQDRLATNNLLPDGRTPPGSAQLADWQQKLELARRERLTRQTKEAIPNLVALLAAGAPETIQRTALLELALAAQDDNDLPRAQQILAQYLSRWPQDPSVPEVLLRQGLILRQMGLNGLALTKFYAVMTSALVLKNDQVGYYQRLVLQAQTEIAETYYDDGKNKEAAEFLARLLKQDSPGLNKHQIEFKLLRSLAALGRNDEVISRGGDFLNRNPDAAERPHVRFYLANAYKQLGRNEEALQQVRVLLQEEQAQAQADPQGWAYWQKRTGNEIANQLYREGDYARALEIYLSLAQLDSTPAWQIPVWYQVGVSYEHLDQPAKAGENYLKIIQREPALGTNATPGLKAVVEMARWRRGFLDWESQAEARNRLLKPQPSAVDTSTVVAPPAAATLAQKATP